MNPGQAKPGVEQCARLFLCDWKGNWLATGPSHRNADAVRMRYLRYVPRRCPQIRPPPARFGACPSRARRPILISFLLRGSGSSPRTRAGQPCAVLDKRRLPGYNTRDVDNPGISAASLAFTCQSFLQSGSPSRRDILSSPVSRRIHRVRNESSLVASNYRPMVPAAGWPSFWLTWSHGQREASGIMQCSPHTPREICMSEFGRRSTALLSLFNRGWAAAIPFLEPFAHGDVVVACVWDRQRLAWTSWKMLGFRNKTLPRCHGRLGADPGTAPLRPTIHRPSTIPRFHTHASDTTESP